MKETALVGFMLLFLFGFFVAFLSAISSPPDYGTECFGVGCFLFGVFGYVLLSAYDR